MSFSNQFKESFRHGVIAGFCFAFTFFIVFYMSYSLPTQLMKMRKNRKNVRHKKKGEIQKLPDHNIKLKIIKEKLKKVRQKDKILPMEFQEKIIQINKVGRLTYRMNFTKLCQATKYFNIDNVIGVGVIGMTFKATLPNGCLLAVTRLYDSQYFIKIFELEIMILGRYNHINILPLIGFCIEEGKNERILVYQYMSNGRLCDKLNETTNLRWSSVIKISLGVARGLWCLHYSLHMVHLSISSECIFLGTNFEPKISNFGGAMFLSKNDLKKNIGLEKKDVFDFGCLLFEVIKGNKIGQILECFSNNDINVVNMLEEPIGFCDVVDEYLNKIEFEDEVSTLLRVALECVHPIPEQRPNMLQVHNKIGNIHERDIICEYDEYCDLLSIDCVTPILQTSRQLFA